MLTDSEIDKIAAGHARLAVSGSLGSDTVVAVRRLVLDDPAGVYFALRLIPGDGLLVGSGGFFVFRGDGTIRTFGSGEVLYVSAALASRAGMNPANEVSPAAIHYLLTHQPDKQLEAEGFEALVTRGRRPWWQFWR